MTTFTLIPNLSAVLADIRSDADTRHDLHTLASRSRTITEFIDRVIDYVADNRALLPCSLVNAVTTYGPAALLRPMLVMGKGE